MSRRQRKETKVAGVVESTYREQFAWVDGNQKFLEMAAVQPRGKARAPIDCVVTK